MKYTDQHFEESYREQLKNCLNSGEHSTDRTGTGTTRIQHAYFEWDGMATIRGKKIFPKKASFEMLWMLRGDIKLKSLKEKNINYWDPWVDSYGEFGPIYGSQFRAYGGVDIARDNNGYRIRSGGIDQLKNACTLIKNEPDSRRIIISLWNPCDLEYQALPPCHCFYQFTVVNNKLNLHVYQRSADAYLGVPYNFVMFSTILKIVAEFCSKEIGRVHYTCADFHIYDNHKDAVHEYLNSELYNWYDPDLDMGCEFMGTVKDNLDDYLDGLWEMDSLFNFQNYKSNRFIGAEVAV